MNYLIVGFGSIGRRHAANIRIIDPDAQITIWHTHRKRDENTTENSCYGRAVYSFEDAIAVMPDAAIITNPSPEHIPISKLLALNGIDLFIEKPISASETDVDDLLNIQKAQKNLIMVGYNFRFHPPLQILKQSIVNGKIGTILSIRAEVGQYLPEWRPGTDYRTSVSSQKALGGGAVLELSHEIDYVRWICGEVTSVTAMADHISDLEIDVEDVAEICLKFSNGAIGSIHLDMVQRPSTRSCKVVGSEGTIVWDGTTDSVKMYSVATGQWSDLNPGEKIERNLMYISELRHFISCIHDRKEPVVNGIDGKRALQIALAALQSSREKRWVLM